MLSSKIHNFHGMFLSLWFLLGLSPPQPPLFHSFTNCNDGFCVTRDVRSHFILDFLDWITWSFYIALNAL